MTDTARRLEPGDAADEGRLLAGVLAGDLGAYAAIMRRYNQRLYRIARSIVTDEAAAMDVVQEAYIAAYQRLHELEDRSAFPAWLARIARNKALMHLRANKRYRSMDEPELEKVLDMSAAARPRGEPDRELANLELRRVLERCIDALPDVFREVFVLRAVEQLTVQETSAILEVKEATVKTRFHRARVLLRQGLLDASEAAGVSVHEFAGRRCDTIVRNVLQRLQAA